MDLPDNIPALKTAIVGFLAAHAGALPEPIREEMMAATGEISVVPMFTRSAEAAYAAVKTEGEGALTGAARTAAAILAGQLANFVGSTFGTLSEGGRGLAIYRAMRRELGETTTPAVANDPAVAEKFAPPASAPGAAPAPETVQ